MIGTIIILLAAAGIAWDNMMFASITGRGYNLSRSANWILIVLFLFIIQYELLFIGYSFASVMAFNLKGAKTWFAIALLATTGIWMLKESGLKKEIYFSLQFDKKYVLPVVFCMGSYVFAFGCSLEWLGHYYNGKNDFAAVLFLLIILGFVLGKYGCRKTLRSLNIVGSILVLLSAVLFIILKLRGGY